MSQFDEMSVAQPFERIVAKNINAKVEGEAANGTEAEMGEVSN